MMAQNPKFIVHDSRGVHLWQTSPTQAELLNSYEQDTKPLNVIPSSDCRYLVITFKQSIKLFQHTNLADSLREFLIPDVKQVTFSPKSTFLQVYSSLNAVNTSNNLKLFDLSNNFNLVHEWTDKKRDLIEWSSDETIAHRLVGSQLLFYEQNDFTKCVHQISQPKITNYSFTTDKAGCCYVALFSKGLKGSPSIIRVHSYPHLEIGIVSKSFYKVDGVETKWNPKGDAILVLASTDYDRSGKSYYGETMLHFLDLRGETCTITGKKEGTVSAAEWLPNNDGFIVIQGKMPSSITWYSNSAQLIHSFGDYACNGIEFNRFGNLVAFTGFGNLSGNVYIWNLKTKTLVSNFKALDTTCFTWLADGQHLVTGTHYDRLKMANGFKVWNYLGSIIHEEDCQNESKLQLYKLFSFDLNDVFCELAIGVDVKGKILCQEPVKKYVPPSLRNSIDGPKFALTKPPPPLPKIKSTKTATALSGDSEKPEDSAKDPQAVLKKKMKNLQKKLQQIENLKKLLEDGKELEKNQLNKIEKEEEILKQIEMLKLQA